MKVITILPGDGIGPEVTAQAVKVLMAVAEVGGHEFTIREADIGGIAIDNHGNPLPHETLEACLESDAVFLGAIGGPKWDNPQAKVRPEQGLLGLRKALATFANIRPVSIYPSLREASPLKNDRLEGTDFVVIRELTGGIYFGEKHRDETSASDLCTYTVAEVERITRVAAKLAQSRGKKLTSVDKANVLETSRLWRATVARVIAEEFPDLELEHLLVDAAAMHLLNRPADFDVIVTENMFGDIITDEAAMLSGSLGLLPSASLGEGGPGLFEPIHGSAPDIAGEGKANPYGAILSLAMLLRFSLNLEEDARRVERAVADAVEMGVLTADLCASPVDTDAVGDAVCQCLKRQTEATV